MNGLTYHEWREHLLECGIELFHGRKPIPLAVVIRTASGDAYVAAVHRDADGTLIIDQGQPEPPTAAALSLQEAAWHLLEAMREAQFAKGMEEQQDARWGVTKAEDELRKVLTRLEEAR